jgi:hypothetical protein
MSDRRGGRDQERVGEPRGSRRAEGEGGLVNRDRGSFCCCCSYCGCLSRHRCRYSLGVGKARWLVSAEQVEGVARPSVVRLSVLLGGRVITAVKFGWQTVTFRVKRARSSRRSGNSHFACTVNRLTVGLPTAALARHSSDTLTHLTTSVSFTIDTPSKHVDYFRNYHHP